MSSADIRLLRHWAEQQEHFGYSSEELQVQIRFALLFVITSFSRKGRVHELCNDFVFGTRLRRCSFDLFSARIDSLPTGLARALAGQPASVIEQIVPRRVDRWKVADEAAVPRAMSAPKATVYREPLPAGKLKFRFVPPTASPSSF